MNSPNDKSFYQFINEFLDENTHLFTILSIFGAISVYLGTITTKLSADYLTALLDIGVFSSLSLFCIIGAITVRAYMWEYYEFRDIRLLAFHRTNIVPLIFLLLFIFLINTVFVIIIVIFVESKLIFLGCFVFLSLFFLTFYFLCIFLVN